MAKDKSLLNLQVINVKYPPAPLLPAKGNGVTDDTLAIQAAIDKLPNGGTLFIPAGTYMVKTLHVRANISLRGLGDSSIIKSIAKNTDHTTYVGLTISLDGNNTSVTRLKVDGNKSKRSDQINEGRSHAVSTGPITNFNISHITVVNAVDASIATWNGQVGTIQNNNIRNSGSNGILGMQACKSIQVRYNTINSTANQDGIFFAYQLGKSSSDIIIEGNTVKNAADFGIEVGDHILLGEEPHRNIKVVNNFVENSTNAGIAFRSVTQGEISGNIIKGYGKNGGYGGDGIFIEGENNLCSDIKITNNMVQQTNSNRATNGIYLTGYEDCLIEGNLVERSGGNGIYLESPGCVACGSYPNARRFYRRILITNNELSNNNEDGIKLQGFASVDNQVSHNIVTGNGAIGIEISNISEGEGLVMNGNVCVSNKKIGIQIYNQIDSTVSGNVITNNCKNAASEDEKCGILIIATNTTIIDNTFNDDQVVPSQIYYLCTHDASGVYLGSNTLLGGSTNLRSYRTSDFIWI